MEKTYLDNLLLSNIEKYDLNNKDLPILMQRYPWLIDIGYRAVKENIDLTMVSKPSDYVYFILSTILLDSIDELPEMRLVNNIKFFEKLEDYLIYIFDIKKVESILFLRKKRKRNIPKRIEENILEQVSCKFQIKYSLFDLISIRTHDSKITFRSVERLIGYTNMLKNDSTKEN